MVETLRYKPEGFGFDSRLENWDISLIKSFWPHYDPEVNSASDRNEYQEYILEAKGGLRLGLTTLLHSCFYTSYSPNSLSRPVQGLI